MAEQAHLITDEDFWQKRKCSKCGEFKFATGYGGETRKWRYSKCPDCLNKESRDNRRKRAPEAVDNIGRGAASVSKIFRQRHRDYLKKNKEWWDEVRKYWESAVYNHGIQKWDWLLLYHRQGGWCGVCREVELKADHNTHIDHDHETGEIRGLLCRQCNYWMAAIDKRGWTRKAHGYKAKHNARSAHNRRRRVAGVPLRPDPDGSD